MRSCSPSHTARLLLAPGCPATSWAGFSCLTSQIRNFLSRLVVTNRDPSALHDKDCTMSLCLRVSLAPPASTSHTLTVKSPDEEARTFSAAGLKRTCPTFLCNCQWFHWHSHPCNQPHVSGEPCHRNNIGGLLGVSPDREVFRNFPNKDLIQMSICVHSCVACEPTLPSSEAEEISESLNGDLRSN
jgi:hypothetical protein